MKNEEKRKNQSSFFDGLYTCLRCHGEGGAELGSAEGIESIRSEGIRPIWITCELCDGSGFIDWVKNATRR